MACIPSVVFRLYLDLDLSGTHIAQARVFLPERDKIDTSGVDDGAGTTAIVVVGRSVRGSIYRGGRVLDTGALKVAGQLLFIECQGYDGLDCAVQVSVAGHVYRKFRRGGQGILL